MIDLDEKWLTEVLRILESRAPDCEVRAFGSRVTGVARRFSDLDLAVKGDEKLDWRRIESLKDAFSESDIPIIVDILDWWAIGEDFRAIVEAEGVVIKTRTESIENPQSSL